MEAGMKIRYRLTLLFTAICASILFAFAIIIYYSAFINRKKEFYNTLQKEAITKANVLLDANVDPETLQTIYHKNRETLNEVEVAIYDTAFNLLYHDAVEIDFVKETPEMLQDVWNKGQITFEQDRWQVLGLLYQFNENDYIITAAAYDDYGYNKLSNLSKTLLTAWLAGIFVMMLAGRYFSAKSLSPVSKMIEKAEAITATNLDLRISEGGSQDEIAELAITFNKMLDRLEQSFEAQKQFVSNISHELRTPLAALMAELELGLRKKNLTDEGIQTMQKALEDARKLSRLSANLLDLARASYDATEISYKEVRLDELMMEARLDLISNQQHYKVNVEIDDTSDSDDSLVIVGNAYLLKTAFLNLMENACKFSEDHSVSVFIVTRDNLLNIEFKDKGCGIGKEDLPNIFKPFYRSKSHVHVVGHGIGLSLTKKILEIHHAKISVHSQLGSGTVFSLEFKAGKKPVLVVL